MATSISGTGRCGGPTRALRRAAEALLIAGTALSIYWQPLSPRFSLKPSDVVFGLALVSWLFLLGWDRGQVPEVVPASRAIGLSLLVLLASLLAGTLTGYLQYHLTMSRSGIALLMRLLVCLTLFLAVRHLSRIDAHFRTGISLAFLAPAILLGAMLVPRVAAGMWVQGRFEGLTVNPNTADMGFVIALAFAVAFALNGARRARAWRTSIFAAIAVAMLTLIVLTQSRAYLAGALAAVLFAALLSAARSEVPPLKIASLASGAFVVVVAGSLLLAPPALLESYLARVSWGTLAPASSDTQTNGGTAPGVRASAPAAPPPPAGGPPPSLPDQAPAESSWVLIHGRPAFIPGRYGELAALRRLPPGVATRLADNPHLQAAILYAELVPANPLGLGVNYEQKFFLRFPWSRGQTHGANSVVDILIYGGLGALASVGYLVLAVMRTARLRAIQDAGQALPSVIGAAAAFGGLWVAALLLGSPIFDYQFWILSAIVLA